MPNFASIWDVTPETAHARARQLLGQSVVWDYGDEDSPLGNDTGADTFAAYLNFRRVHPSGLIEKFVREQLSSHGFSDSDWDLLDADRLQEWLGGAGGIRFLRRDDFIIAVRTIPQDLIEWAGTFCVLLPHGRDE